MSENKSGKLRRFAPVLIFLIMASLLLYMMTRMNEGDYNPRDIPTEFIGRAAPEFSLPELFDPDETVSTSSMKGEIWLLNVWATWCRECWAEHEYLLALRTQGPGSALARSARRKLELWDVAETDVQAIASTGKVRRAFAVRSPRTGFVLDKNIVEGARTRAGDDLYRIADLSRIWVTAEVYEFDAPWVEVGQSAQMELSFEEGKILEGKVAYIYPTLNPVSRTLTVRLEFENPEMRLKPGMFATVYIQHRRRDDALAVPTEAIIDSGRRKIVFVSTGDGHFEPREISTGLTGDRHVTEVLSGLEEGDPVVVSGQFLLDSESQLQEAIGKMAAQAGEER
jgi:Cu(I)/Ag(I) efflux system membrane fusion protein/cobalt-zinc-cadmium efflux system membrane fusion protein